MSYPSGDVRQPRISAARDLSRRRPWLGVWTVFGFIALLGLLVRLPHLGARPMHTDEAVNAYILGQVLAGKAYTYDPRDRHGPALPALALPLARVLGATSFSNLTETELRLSPVLAGTGTILLFGAAVEIFGLLPCVVAALLFALAPLPVYYDRYFIHESLFAAATFSLIVSSCRGWKSRSVAQAAVAGASAALMAASKETFVLHLFALAAAGFCFWMWNLHGKPPGYSRLLMGAAVVGAAAFLLLGVTLFTWFGSNWRVAGALLQAFPNLVARAAGEGHQKPFWYYGHLLARGWSGTFILTLFFVGWVLTVRRRDRSPYGILAFYFLFLALLYSLIPYKTPWLTLNLWLPITLFAGRAIEDLWRMRAKHEAWRVPIAAFCAVGATVLAALIAHDTRQRIFLEPSAATNPYAYALTSEDLLGLAGEIDRLARQNAIPEPRIAVIASDPWPLPWYLRRFSEVGFWQPGQQPGRADFYVTSTEAANLYTDQFKDLQPEFFGVRPGVLILLWSPAPK